MTAHQVDLHGLTVRFEARDPVVLDGLVARLEHLSPAPDAAADLVIVYGLEQPRHDRPADGRTVYQSAGADAVYSPAEDALYAFHRHGPTMRCDAAAGRAEIAGSTSPDAHAWVLTRPLPTLALMELVRRRGLYPLHAGCLAWGDEGVIVSGPSGSGKSTLTLALLEAGLAFLGDDLVFLRPSGEGLRALGFPDELGLTEDTRTVTRAVDGALDLTPPPGWPKARAGVHDVAPDADVASSCTPGLVVLLSERAAPGTLEEVDADEALLELLPSILLTDPATCAAHLDALGALARGATILRSAQRPDLGAMTARILASLP